MVNLQVEIGFRDQGFSFFIEAAVICHLGLIEARDFDEKFYFRIFFLLMVVFS